MKPISFLFLIVVAVNAYTSTIHVNLEREILKTGFHRVLNTTLIFKTFPKKNCELNVLQEISPTWYISDDEYENLRRFSTDLPEIHYLNGKNDIEKPSWKCETKQILLTMNLKTKTPSVVLPIHFRYQKPSLNKKFRKVMIKKPSLVYLTCGIEKHKITFEKQIKKDTWKTKTIYMDDISAEIPVGNLNHLFMVRVGTNLALISEDKSDVVDLTDSKEKEEQQNCILIEPEIFEEMKCSD
eukprot:gene10980-3686_t